MSLKTLCLLLCLAVTSQLAAQVVKSKSLAWAQIGPLTDTKNRNGFQMGLNYQFKRSLFALRFYQSSDKSFVPFREKKTNYVSNLKNLSFLYGPVVYSNKYCKLIPQIGLSAGEGNWRKGQVDTTVVGDLITWKNPKYNYDSFHYVGVMMNLNFLWMPTKHVGFGLEIYRNFNKHSENGLGLSVVLGNLR